jgi:hypothetical protein
MNNDQTAADHPLDNRVINRRLFLGRALALSGTLLLPDGLAGRAASNIEPNHHHHSAHQPDKKLVASAEAMAVAAEAFFNSLSAAQRDKVRFAFHDEQRYDWHYVPRARKGVPLKELEPAQRQLALALLQSSLSQRGATKVTTIISLENILRELEQGRGPVRDPELYYFSIFGQPRASQPWGWRIEGHHVSLNYTIGKNGQVASTPAFLGSNPAEVREGPRKGLRALAGEDDLARALLKSLDDQQRRLAVISNEAPKDILTTNSRRATPQQPAGIGAGKLSGAQTNLLMSVIQEYADNMPRDIAQARLAKIRGTGLMNVSFAWAGGLERGQPCYYRIQGPSFLIEYDNTQNNANHIHSVWRDFNGDFGQDLLAMHYEREHRNQRHTHA